MSKIEVYEDDKEHFRLRLKTSNNEVIYNSDPYTRKRDCIALAHAALPTAEIIDLTNDSLPEKKSKIKVQYCHRCRRTLYSGVKFCDKCGAALARDKEKM